jgi:signal transduction histidine kinase/DNA-binding response OmpR family regulator
MKGSAPASEPVNILVVDDLATQRLTIEVALAELGERVISVESGREALKFLLDNEAAVILLDVNMPEMDGFETATLIRQRNRTANTPIIFLTADSDELQAARGYALGAVDYLICPFLPDVLRTKVKVFVTLSRTGERIRREAQQQIELTREQTARALAEDQSRRLRLMVDAGGILTRSLDGSAFEGELLGLFVPHLADEAGLVFLDGGQRPGPSTWVHAGPVGSPVAQPATTVHPMLAGPMTRVLASGRPEPIPGPGGEGVGGIVLPLEVRGKTYGALGMAMIESGRRYSDADLEVLMLVAGRTATALDNRRLYRELQDRDRRKDEFLAMLSHELRNPLGAITTAARLLEMFGNADERAARACQVVTRQSFHLARMVEDLLEVSRVTTGRITLSHAPIDLREVVDRAVEAVRASGRLDQHQLTVRGDRLIVEADGARMEQVITNLLVNAVKYTDPGGRIEIDVDREESQALVTVSDNGIGISPELLPRLFDLFVQGRQDLDRARGGLGLGLTLVKKLIELQGGTVDAFSGGLGQGSRFVVRLPQLAHSAALPVEEAPATPSRPLRVLLVEDNDDAREMLRTWLESGGHTVREASNGPDAVEHAIEFRPQLAIIDLGLPGFDGLEVARRLRSDPRTRAALRVALTGYGQGDDRRRTLENGFDAHLVKPVAAEKLREVVQLAAQAVVNDELTSSTSS